LHLRLRDHGPGISPGTRKHLFKPFHKSAQQAASSKPGVGLGLALSRRLARALGGNLSLESTCQPGTCFLLELPIT
jgi:signal transduction histidine kinase